VLWVNVPVFGLNAKVRRLAEATVILEPDSKATSKVLGFTTSEANVALDPDMVKSIPATAMIASVVSVTSSEAAELTAGTTSSANKNIIINFFIFVCMKESAV